MDWLSRCFVRWLVPFLAGQGAGLHVGHVGLMLDHNMLSGDPRLVSGVALLIAGAVTAAVTIMALNGVRHGLVE